LYAVLQVLIRIVVGIFFRVEVVGRDNVPAGAPATEVVERSEAPGDVIGCVEGGRAGGDKTDALRNL